MTARDHDAAVVTIEATVDETGRIEWSRPQVAPDVGDRDDGWVVRLVDDEPERDDLGDRQRDRLQRSRDRTARSWASSSPLHRPGDFISGLPVT